MTASRPTDPSASLPIDDTLSSPAGNKKAEKPAGAEAPSFKNGERLAGRYLVARFLGRGGMGEVYEVESVELKERVALKTLRGDQAQEGPALERFRREVQLARKVSHPNVCRIFDLGVHEHLEQRVVFLTMELLNGESLAERLRRGRLAPAEALPIVRQIAAGLDAAHAAGVVHRDFKSGNVMLVGSRAVVADFGLARLAVPDASPLTCDGAVLGTPAYMAPEQVQGKPATEAADVYALGVVLFEMMTGRLPFLEETALATALARIERPAPSPRSVLPALDERWDTVILRCLERDPARRFRRAGDVAAALEASTSETFVSSAGGPKSRSRAVLAGAVAVGALLAALAVGLGSLLTGPRPAPAAPAGTGDREAARASLDSAVRAMMPAANACYQAAQQAGEELDGELDLRISVNGAAGVEASVEQDKLGSPVVAACVMTQVNGIRVTDAMKGAQATYPFKFSPVRTLAVLPFANLAGDAGADWIRTAIAEALLAKLGQLPQMVVVDRAQLRAELGKLAPAAGPEALAKAASDAGARVAVVGGFQKVGTKLRLSASLWMARANKERATVEADGSMDDLFAIEDRLAARLVDALNIPESTESKAALAVRTGSSLAILELLGKAGASDRKTAAALYRQVIALDPKIPEAHFGLAESLSQQPGGDAAVVPEFEEAIRLRPDYYEALVSLGNALWATGEYGRAFEIQARAVRLKPQYAAGYYGLALSHATRGDADDAIALITRAVDLEPNEPETQTQRGTWLVLFRRDFAEGVRLTEAATHMKGASDWNDSLCAYAKLMAGDAAGCLATLAEGATLRPATASHTDERMAIEAACTLKAGNPAAARTLFSRIDPGTRILLERKPPREMPRFVQIEFEDLGAILKPIASDR